MSFMNRHFNVCFCLRFFAAFFLCSLSPYAAADDYWSGEEYYNNSTSQKDAADILLKYVTIMNGDRVLDVGCGDGKITAGIAANIPAGTVKGIDISPSMIKFAQTTYENGEHPNLSFELGDAQNIGGYGSVDVIVAFTSLQWLENHEAFLDGAGHILQPHGILAVTMPMGLPSALKQAVDEIASQPQWSPYFEGFSTGWNFVSDISYGQMLSDRHFDVIRLSVEPQKDVFPSRQAFQGFISQWFPYLRPLPQDLKQTFMTLVIDRFLELETPFPNEEVHFKVRRLEVVAAKKI